MTMAINRYNTPRGAQPFQYVPPGSTLDYAEPEVQQAAATPPQPVQFGGWNTENIFDEDYWHQINEQAKQGMFTQSRDDIANARDDFMRQYEQQYHNLAAQQGARAEGGGGLLGQDPQFRAFVQQGTTPTFQTPTQQWNAAPAPAPPPESAGTAPATGGAQATVNDLMKLLMERAQRGFDVDRNDPAVRSQADAFGAQQERSRRQYLSGLAERQGGRPVNLLGEERLAAERAGQATGGFEAELIGREIGARREEAAQALSLAVATGNQQAALEAQRQLAELDDRARTADRNQSWEAFLRELALREWQAGNENDWRWAGL